LKAEFESPFPKLDHQKRKYDSQIEKLNMNYMFGNKLTGDSFKFNLNAVNMANNLNDVKKIKNIELYFEDKKSKPNSVLSKRKIIRSISSDNPSKSNESLHKNNDSKVGSNINIKSPKKFYYLSQNVNKHDEPDIQYDFIAKKRVALV
jgi:hypothetical protein